jgi:DNA-binding IclR family transcriptional regulator
MRILRHLSENGKPAGATELARRLNINTSTCFNILRTLVSEGVMEFDPASKTYRPGVGLLKLVDSTLSEGHRLEMAKPVLHDLAERRAVTATLWRRIGDQRIVLAAVEHNLRDMRIHMSTGQRLPLLLGATGRLLAGELGLTQAQARSMFAGLRWARPLAFEQYWDEVELARARGWAVDDGYFAPGILAVATAVRDGGGRLAFALSSVMFRGQYDEAAIEALGVEMQALSDKLGKILF